MSYDVTVTRHSQTDKAETEESSYKVTLKSAPTKAPTITLTISGSSPEILSAYPLNEDFSIKVSQPQTKL